MPDPSAADARRDRLNAALEALHFAFRAVVEGPDATLAQRGLSRVHHRILFFIARTPELSVTDLRTTLDVTKQSLNGPLRELTERGLVAESTDRDDRRVKRLHLTAQGRQLEERLSGQQRDRFEQVFRRVGRDGERAWHEVMRLLAEGPDLEQ